MSSSGLRLCCAWLTLFVIGTDLFVVSPLLPTIAADLALAPSSAGWCVTAFSVSYMAMAPVLGRMADEFGRRPLLLVALLAFAAANLASAMAGDVVGLLAARAAAGVAAAGITPSVYALIGDCAPPDRRATWLAAAVSGLLLSLAIGAPIGTLVGEACGWPSVFLAIAVASGLLAPLNHAIWRTTVGAPSALGRPRSCGFPLMAQRVAPTVVWSTALYAVYTYLGVGLANWGYSPQRIAEAVMCYGAGALVGTLLGGRLADRLGARRVSLFSLSGLGAGLFTLGPALHVGVPIELLLLAISGLAQMFFPAQQAGLARDFAASRATVMAWNNSALFLGIGTGSLIGGEIFAKAGFLAVATISAMIAVAGAAVIGMVTPYPAPTEPARSP
jgi:predicted MFS family arabinose efflux permease